MNKLELTGQTDTHLKHHLDPDFSAQPQVLEAFLEMTSAAAKHGYQIHPVSAYRDLHTQLSIWNMKFAGRRPLLSENGKIIDPTKLNKDELLKHVLYWSALPGASRHHWGTEIDVIDLSAVPKDYQVQLIPEEFEKEGVFFGLNGWLDENMNQFGFFKPYRTDRGGVLPEPWHLSYRSIADRALKDFTIEILKEVIENIEIEGKQEVLEILPKIYSSYILNIDDDTNRGM